MIVPPRLVAGWLPGCAVAVLLAIAAENAAAQTRIDRAPSGGLGLNAPLNGRVETSNQPNELRSGSTRGTVGQPASWGARGKMHGYLPRHLRTSSGAMSHLSQPPMVNDYADGQVEIIDDGGPLPPGATIIEDGEALPGEPGLAPIPGDVAFEHGHDGCTDGSCGGGSCGGGSCGGDACGSCGQVCCCCIPVPCLNLPHNFAMYGGVHGFKGPINRGADSSFGFDEAINWGIPFGDICGMGVQLGVRGVHSNFSGSTNLTNDTRNQIFVTGGLFRRVDCGLQYGAVFDWLHEDWDVRLDLGQVRGEISWVFVSQGELGFRYTGGVSSDDSDAPPPVVGIDWNPVDQYAIFGRQKLLHLGGEIQAYAGFTGDGEGLLGANAILPLGQHVAMSAEFAYLVPETGAVNVPIPGSIEESWNVGVGLVMYPGAGFFDPSNYYRPLFDVANNGTFFYDID